MIERAIQNVRVLPEFESVSVRHSAEGERLGVLDPGKVERVMENLLFKWGPTWEEAGMAQGEAPQHCGVTQPRMNERVRVDIEARAARRPLCRRRD